MNRLAGMAAALLCLSLPTIALPAATQAAENRCGWISNPTPRNWWLDDRDKTWTIMTQGAEDEEPEGMELIPDISEKEFVKTNGYYGYSCACLSVETDGDERITRIFSFKQLKLSQCRNDKALKFKG